MNLLSARSYLRGEKFSAGLNLEIDGEPEEICSRINLVERMCSQKSIIHVGCVDHVPLIKEKIQNGSWLHDRLTRVATRCEGIDINKEGVDYVRGLGYLNVHCIDVMENNISLGFDGNFDYVLLGEVIEHVNNPAEFLSRVRSLFMKMASKVVLTAPNALRLENFRFALRGMESINTDHRFWFTPFTLAKAAEMAGITVERVGFCQGVHNNRSFMKKAFYQKFPMLAYGLYLVGSL